MNLIEIEKKYGTCDLFGGDALIKTGHSEGTHWYKIIGLIESNEYCDIPILTNSTPCVHDDVVPVLNVVYYDELQNKMIRVALKDCHKIIPPRERGAMVPIKVDNHYVCAECNGKVEEGKKFCPHCGNCQKWDEVF